MSPEKYRAQRKKIGTQGDVAKALGVALNTVSRRELGNLEIPREAELALRYLVEKIRTPIRKRVG